MKLTFSILGLIGGLLCCVGDILFDLKGPGNEKRGTSRQIDTNWEKMAYWRFGTSILCAFAGDVLDEAKIKKHPEDAAYRRAFAGSFFPSALTGGRVKKESIYNQFYSDLVTKIDDSISRNGTTIHVFYAIKMGEKYEARYRRHFAAPDIRRHDMNHEELLFCYPEQWAAEVFNRCGMEGAK